MLHFFLLALASAVYPLLLGATVIMLGGQHPVRVLAGYLVGGAIVSIGVGIALLHLLDSSGATQGDTGRTFHPWAEIVLGTLAIAIGIAMATGSDARLRRRRHAKETPAPAVVKEPWSRRVLGKESAPMAFVIGMCFSLPSVYYLSALTFLAAEYQTTATAYALLIVFNVIQFAIVEIPLVCYVVAPDATRRRVRSADAWLSAHWRDVAQWAALVIGAYLVIRGVVQLAT